MRKLSAGFLSLFIYLFASAQTAETVVDTAAVAPPVLTERQLGLQKRKAMENSTLLSNVEFTNIGPTIMSGRVTDLDKILCILCQWWIVVYGEQWIVIYTAF